MSAIQIPTTTPAGADWTSVVKASDESVASNVTPQDDDELFFTTVSGTRYEIELFLLYGSPAGGGTPDMRVAVGEDTTIRGTVQSLGVNTTGTATSSVVHADRSIIGLGTDTGDRLARLTVIYIGAGGTFRLQWSQTTTSVNATIVRAGSVLRYREIA